MALLQHPEDSKWSTVSSVGMSLVGTASGKRRLDPRFNVSDPEFDFHDPEYLAYIANAPREVKEEALDAAIGHAMAEYEAGQALAMTPEQFMQGQREGLSFEAMRQRLQS